MNDQDHTGQDSCQKAHNYLTYGLGVEDGELIEIEIRRLGTKPLPQTVWKWLKPRTYGPVFRQSDRDEVQTLPATKGSYIPPANAVKPLARRNSTDS